MKQLKILIHGTRGKSSLVRYLHKTFFKSGYSVISRETGMNTTVRFNERIIDIEREKRYAGFRNLETCLIIRNFFNKINADIKILENNCITLSNTISVARFFKPDAIIITTWGVDHVEAQGFSIEETLRFYLKEVLEANPKLAIFWTNFSEEHKVAKEVLKSLKIKGIKIKLLFSPLEKRNGEILNVLKNSFKLSINIQRHEEKDIVRKRENIINIGDINDPACCLLWIHENLKKEEPSRIVFFFNLRCDRKDRTFAFLEAVLPNLPEESEKAAFVEDIITYAYCKSKGINRIFTDVNKALSFTTNNKNKTFVILGNTVNDFGKEIIEKYKILKD